MSATNKVVREPNRYADCKASSEILSRFGDKWTVLVVGTLSQGTHRYSDLMRAVEGISQRMLTLTLKGLEEDGLVERTVYPTVPPRVDYTLTELGRTIIEPLRAVHDWSVKYRPAMLAAREAHAKRQRRQ